MKDLIKIIKNGENINELINLIKMKLFGEGPNEAYLLEALAYIKLFHPTIFRVHEHEILEIMGLFYKEVEVNSFLAKVFDVYKEEIKEEYGKTYTPMQVNILNCISEQQYFSFSAPTSTGKSYVFRDLILSSTKDVVIVVPSRALINEYYDKLLKIVSIKDVNVLTYVERINVKHAKRSIFILTPERARELFKNKNWLDIEFVLFDEAQLSDEKSIRGLNFDAIVRRALKAFPTSKFIYAHPFIVNPEAQLQKNGLDITSSKGVNYTQRNVGQIFYAHKVSDGTFYHFGSDKEILGKTKLKSDFDPIERIISRGGSVLFYVSKSSILKKKVYIEFEKYISMCQIIENEEAKMIIRELKEIIGATEEGYKSEMIEKLSRGIVVHHGSMPLNARILLEKFTQKGFCRICFATSTLEQGINMPFDIVYLDRLEKSKILSVKNMIGRAGRTTAKAEFDYGSIIVKEGAMSDLRKVLKSESSIMNISRLDEKEDNLDLKYQEFKEAINTDQFSDDYNLTNKDLEMIKSENCNKTISRLLDKIFINDVFAVTQVNQGEIIQLFSSLYEIYLNRPLIQAEKYVFENAIKILIYRIYGRTFGSICQQRYNHIAKKELIKSWLEKGDNYRIQAEISRFSSRYIDIPNQHADIIPLFGKNVKAIDVDYDTVVYDTYDYLDKIINFRLGDLFYAMFSEYFHTNGDIRAKNLANYVRYGTSDATEIWLLKYGFELDDAEWIKPHLLSISEEEMIFDKSVESLDEGKKRKLYPFYP